MTLVEYTTPNEIVLTEENIKIDAGTTISLTPHPNGKDYYLWHHSGIYILEGKYIDRNKTKTRV
jgi:hypothetical protein